MTTVDVIITTTSIATSIAKPVPLTGSGMAACIRAGGINKQNISSYVFDLTSPCLWVTYAHVKPQSNNFCYGSVVLKSGNLIVLPFVTCVHRVDLWPKTTKAPFASTYDVCIYHWMHLPSNVGQVHSRLYCCPSTDHYREAAPSPSWPQAHHGTSV